jgi:hypothetical protein
MTVFNLKKFFLLGFVLIATIFAAIGKNTIADPVKDSVVGGNQDFITYRNKTFNVDKNTTVVLSNKYGSIDVHTGTGSKVIVKVKITVTSTSQMQADKVFDRVNIAFIEGPEFVKTETIIENAVKSTTVWASNNAAENIDYRIDYDVTMPAGNRLDVTNRHGNSTIAALTTSVKIDQKYGDFRLAGASSATVVLAYGGGELSALNTLNGNVSYGKLTSPNIKNGRLQSTYSQFRFDEIGTLEVLSAYDVFEINNIANLKGKCKYSSMNVRNAENVHFECRSTAFKLQKLENNADLDCTNGTIRIGSIKNNFGTVNIKGTSTDCILVVDQSVCYLLDVNGSYTNMSQPASMRTTIDNKQPAHREVMGIVGGNPNTKSVIRVQMTYGDLRIR